MEASSDYDLINGPLSINEIDNLMVVFSLANMDYLEHYTPSKEENVFDCLDILAQTIQVELPDANGLIAYHALLHTYPVHVLRAAAVEVLKTHTYRTMPLPAEILETSACRKWKATESWWGFIPNHYIQRLHFVKGRKNADHSE